MHRRDIVADPIEAYTLTKEEVSLLLSGVASFFLLKDEIYYKNLTNKIKIPYADKFLQRIRDVYDDACSITGCTNTLKEREESKHREWLREQHQ